MGPLVGLGNLVQAGIYGAGWYWLKERWGLSANIAMGCCVLQMVGAGSLFLRRERIARWCSMICLVGMGLLLGQFYAAADHLTEAYGNDARNIGEKSIQALWLAIPWGFFFPTWQALHGGLKALIAPAIAIALPLLFQTNIDGPIQNWPAQVEYEAAAQAAFFLWNGQDTPIPDGVGPATVLFTPFEDGKAGKAVRGDGKTLGEAVAAAVARLPPPGGVRSALVMDLARIRYPRGANVPAGDGGGLSKRSGLSPTVAWRPGNMGNRRVAPKWFLPRPKLGKRDPTKFDSVLVDATGAYLVSGGWTVPPELSADTALEAALAGGRMLAHHQNQAGRYAYKVSGPSGRVSGKGYNFPRHAGTTWFLARLAQRTGDPEIIEAAQRGLLYMESNTNEMDGGRAYLGDPRRGDGKAWVGTTSLAVLAALAADHPRAISWGRFIASSVNEQGMVRGEMNRKTGEFLSKKKNPYGQGQTTLAIAALVRAGHDEFRPVLERLATYLDGDYAPGGAGRLFVLDEHWTCIAALVIKDALGRPAGAEVCHAYLNKEAEKTPNPGSRIRPYAAAAGGLAEAVVAAAMLHDDHKDDALAYGAWFLRSAYRQSDSALLPKPLALIGGFRDTPHKLDVQMDGVQHIGCALLGIEGLLSEMKPGSLP
jgi:hypothetical protein